MLPSTLPPPARRGQNRNVSRAPPPPPPPPPAPSEPGASEAPGSLEGRGPSRRLLGNREDPDHAALRHVLLPAEKVRDQPLLEGRVDAPAGHDADVLSAVDGEGEIGRAHV